MKKYLKIISLVACATCALVLMSGCSLLGPKSAEDVIEKYNKAQEKIESYHTQGNIDITETFTAENAEVQKYMQEALGTDKMSIPISMDISMDAGRETAHGNIDLAMSFAGQSTNEAIEMYIDQKNKITYSKAKGGEWTKSTSDDTFLSVMGTGATNAGDWKNFKFEKTDNGYVLSATMKELKDNAMLDSFSGYLGDTTISDFTVSDDGKVVYVFDKKCNLVAIEIKDVIVTGAADMGNGLGNLNCEMTMDMKFNLSQYNELQEEDYAIPSKVIKSAVDGTTSITPDPGTGETPSTPTEPTQPTEPAEPAEPATPATPSSGSTTLDGSKVQGQNNKFCFVVGQDIAPGTYKIYKVSGSGIFSVSDAVTYDTNYNFNIGYGLPEDTPDGTQVVLETGDEIYITSELIVELK